MSEENALNINISRRNLINFAVPTILSNIFMNIYSIIDGMFVSNCIGTDALAAVNVSMPVLMIIMALAVMVGTGGNALVSMQLGQGKLKTARQDFSLLFVFCIVACLILSVIILIFLSEVLKFLGANDVIFDLCMKYIVPIVIALPFIMGGMILSIFLIAEGKPWLGMISSVAGGFVNIFLDYLFLVEWKMGLEGAAYATSIGYLVSSLIGLYYFGIYRRGTLKLILPHWNPIAIYRALTNGASELVSMLAMSVVTIVLNRIVINLSGADGVAAVGIVFYAESILSAIFMGYSSGIESVTSFNLGRKDFDNLQKIYNYSRQIVFSSGLFSFIFGLLFAKLIISAFVEVGTNVYNMATNGFNIYAFSFLFMGFNFYVSSFFTALNDGKTSAIFSFCHTMVFLLSMLIILPKFFGMFGVWISVPIAECLCCMFGFWLVRYKKVFA